MRNTFFSLILLINLTGCVGFVFERNGNALISETDFSRVEIQYSYDKPNRVADKNYPDGSEMYVLLDETRWCGLTIFAIIPIPLWLPVCQAHTEVIYKEGKLIHTSSQHLKSTIAMCGVVMPLNRMGGGSSDFCQWYTLD